MMWIILFTNVILLFRNVILQTKTIILLSTKIISLAKIIQNKITLKSTLHSLTFNFAPVLFTNWKSDFLQWCKMLAWVRNCELSWAVDKYLKALYVSEGCSPHQGSSLPNLVALVDASYNPCGHHRLQTTWVAILPVITYCLGAWLWNYKRDNFHFYFKQPRSKTAEK